MALSDPFAYDGKTYDGKELRQFVDAIYPTPGVVEGFGVTAQSSPNATVRVAAGTIIVQATAAGEAGSYAVSNDASLNSGSFAPTSGNPRWDYLILRVTSGVAALEIVQGTASASPAAPTITGDNYQILALVKLPGSTSNVTNAMITDSRTFTGHWAEPWGFVARTQITADSSPAGGTATVSGLSASTTAAQPAGRYLRITIGTYALANAGTGNIGIIIAEGTTAVQERIVGVGIAVANCAGGELSAIVTSTGGVQTWNFRTTTASSAVNLVASSGHPSFIRIEDLGPAANPTP